MSSFVHKERLVPFSSKNLAKIYCVAMGTKTPCLIRSIMMRLLVQNKLFPYILLVAASRSVKLPIVFLISSSASTSWAFFFSIFMTSSKAFSSHFCFQTAISSSFNSSLRSAIAVSIQSRLSFSFFKALV